jgi:hypothetical protein
VYVSAAPRESASPLNLRDVGMADQLQRRGIRPQPSTTANPSTMFETTYQRNYVTDDGKPKQGDRFPRAAQASSTMATVLNLSGTTLADSLPIQRSSYQNPNSVGTQPPRLSKINQPKAQSFQPMSLSPTSTRCK